MAMATGRTLIEVILSRFLNIIIAVVVILIILIIIIMITYEECEKGGHVILVHSQEVSLVKNLHVNILKKLRLRR